jgi:hypothetical protein
VEHRIVATVKTRGGTRVIKTAFPSWDAVDAELRYVYRLREHECDLPEIFWVDIANGQGNCLSYLDIVDMHVEVDDPVNLTVKVGQPL